MHTFYLLLSLWTSFSAPVTTHAEVPEDKVLSCTAQELNEALAKVDPGFARQQDSLREAWSEVAKNRKDKALLPPPFLIPVVFHVVHENGTENISDADIIRSLDFLNQSFANTDYYDQGTGVPTGIQFCLAARTPDNQPTNGITRTTSPLTNLNTNDDLQLKDLSRWPSREYLNIWVVREICGLGLGCGVAGYAYYPGAHGGSRDGIVVEARHLTRNEARASVLTHEAGHYLGLRHTFDGGCLNDDCTRNGDGICDTPPDQSKVAVPCSGSVNTCTTDTDSGFATDQDDMFINYMDYGYWSCYSAFTAGQRDRMQFTLDGIRRSLQESKGCELPCPALVTASFTGGNITVEVGSTLNFTNSSSNGSAYSWRENGTTFTSATDATRTFNAVGTYRIRLVAASGSPLCYPDSTEQIVTVVCSVTAGFTVPSQPVVIDSLVTFVNTSTNGTSREWTVDGTLVGTGTDLGQTFTAPGVYTVCLNENNGGCERSFCRTLFVRTPPCTTDCPEEDDCTAPFAFLYQTPGGEEPENYTFSSVLPVADGFVLAGHSGFFLPSFVMYVGPEGQVRWQTQLFPDAPSGAFITRLMADSEGFIIAAGYTILNSGTFAQLACKIDPTDGRVLWANTYAATNEAWTTVLLSEPTAGGAYELIGHLEQSLGLANSNHQYHLQLERNSGAILAPPTKFSLPQELAPDDGVIGDGNNSFYTISTALGNNSTGSISAVVTASSTLDGTAQWSQSFNYPQGSGLVGKAILPDNGRLICVGQPVEPQRLGSQRVNLWSFGPDEGLAIQQELILGTSVIVEDLLQNGLGYLISLSTSINNEVVLLQTDFSGNPLWCRQYDLLQNEADAESVWTTDNTILVAGQQSGTPILLRLNAAGSTLDGCLQTLDLPVDAIPLNLRNEVVQLATSNEDLATSRFFSEPGSLQLSAASCLPDCPEVPDNDECASSFSLNFTTEGPLSLGTLTTALPFQDGYLIGGFWNRSQGVTRVDAAGEIIWQLPTSIAPEQHRLTQLVLDSEQQLIGISNVAQDAIIFKIDPITGTLIWSRVLREPGSTIRLNKIINPGPGRDYQVFGYSQNSGITPAIQAGLALAINPVDGTLTTGNSWSFNSGGRTSFEDAIFDENTNTFYVTGRESVGRAATRGLLLSLNQNMEINWIRSLEKPNNVGPQTATYSIERDRDTLLVLGQDILPGDINVTEVWKTTVSGDFLAGYRFPIGSFLGSRPEKIAATQNGYFISGYDATLTPFTSVRQIVHLAKNGRVLWARAFDSQGAALDDRQGMSLTETGILYAHGNDNDEVSLLKFDYAGNIPDCANAFPKEITTTPFSGQLQVISLGRQVFNGENFPAAGEPGQPLQATTNCITSCDPAEICDNQTDDDNDGLTDCDDPDLAFSCCCLAVPSLSLGPDTTVCPGFVLHEGTSREFSSYAWSTGATGDSITITEAGTYWLMITDSCGNVATDTLTLHLRPRPFLDLGPDTVLCSNAVLPFFAQDGFADYQWVDGSTEKSFTAYDAGTYWVVATDSCGNVSTDTVQVSILPATVIDLGNDTTICRGDTLTFRLSGFTDYQWSQSSFLDCADCPEVRFAPTQDTLLLVAARLNANCFSSDSIRVRVTTAAGSRTTQTICAGDSLAFGGQMVGQAGQYFTQVTNGNCRVTDTLDVMVLDTLSTREDITLCAGDSIALFGIFRTAAGTYAQTFPASTGCDSTHRVTLSLRDSILTQETRAVCAGDSVLIFGAFETMAGTYQRSFSATGGCDSTHQILLEVTELEASAIQIQPACGAAAGAGEVLFNAQVGAVIVRWPDGTVAPTNENLSAGDYTVTVTTATGGCAAELDLTITQNALPEFSLVITPETCPDENDGTLLINGLTGATYRLEPGTEQADNTFTNLAPGEYLLAISDSLGCTEEALTISIEPAQDFLLGLPETLTLSLGDSVLLTPQVSRPAAQISWQSTLGDTCTACPVFPIRPLVSTVVSALAIDSNGCSSVAETNIIVREDDLFYVPNAFSPNGDGVNDVFRVYGGPAVEEVLSLAVYDRWGNQAFLAEIPDQPANQSGWDGRSANGKIAGVGVYVYVVEVRLFTGKVVRQAGEVLVLR